jgi:hypothetical protein
MVTGRILQCLQGKRKWDNRCLTVAVKGGSVMRAHWICRECSWLYPGQPPPDTTCRSCGGELLLDELWLDDAPVDGEVEVYV